MVIDKEYKLIIGSDWVGIALHTNGKIKKFLEIIPKSIFRLRYAEEAKIIGL